MTHKHNLFKERLKKHNKLENKVANIIRPYTTRNHLPDRFVVLGDYVVAWDLKSNIFVEKNSHDEYFRLQNHDRIKVFIVYDNAQYAEWIDNLNWDGPNPPTKNSTSGDPYYKISGGISLNDFLEREK